MDPEHIFRVFNDTITELVRSTASEHVAAILEQLAEGNEALVNGLVFGKLPGLDQQGPATPPNSNSKGAMMKLLLWGIKHFPIDPAQTGFHFWWTLGKLDSRRCYNQK